MDELNRDWVDPKTGEPAWWPKPINRPYEPKPKPEPTTFDWWGIAGFVVLALATAVLLALWQSAEDRAATFKAKVDWYECQQSWDVDFCDAEYEKALAAIEANR